MSDDEKKGMWEGVAATLGTVIGTGIIGFIVYKYRDNIPSGIMDIPGGIATFVANVMPFALLVYGFSGDIVNQEYRLSVPSIAAIVSIFIFGVFGQFLATSKGTDLRPQDSSGKLWCSIPGLESIESPYFPTAIMSTTIIAFYYLCWTWHTNRNSAPLLLWFSAILCIQLATFMFGECLASYTAPYNSTLLVILSPILVGIIIGAITFAAAKSSQNPFNIPLASPSAATGSPGASADASAGGGHSQQVQGGGDENTFVAELYKNGQLVTDSISS
jgi:hypothetical protein